MVDLVRAGRDPEELAKEFEPTAQSIRNRVALADQREGRRPASRDALIATEREELLKLGRENKQFRQERDIFSRATAGSASLTIPPGDRLQRWFARETNIVPSGSSNS
jgi:transposase